MTAAGLHWNYNGANPALTFSCCDVEIRNLRVPDPELVRQPVMRLYDSGAGSYATSRLVDSCDDDIRPVFSKAPGDCRADA